MGVIERTPLPAQASLPTSRDEVLDAALGSGLSIEMMVERLLDRIAERRP
jgi:hypothetical protein